MTNNKISLSRFLNLKEEAFAKMPELLNGEKFQALKDKIESEKKGFTLDSSFYEDVFMLLLDKLDELLDIDIPKDILAQAWSKHQDLLEYRDSEQYPPEVTFLVPLVQHSLSTKHAPSIEPSLAGKSLVKLELEIEVEFLIKGAILSVQNGRIMKIRLGAIEGTGSLGLAGISVLEKENTLEIPYIIDLGEGVPIRQPFAREESEEDSEKAEVEDVNHLHQSQLYSEQYIDDKF